MVLLATTAFAYNVATTPKPLNVLVVYYKLPNGLKVVISEDHIAPVVTVAVYYNVGSRLEPKAASASRTSSST